MERNMFKGFRSVFGFTLQQHVKTKSFKVAVILGSLILFFVFFGINMGVGIYKDTKSDKKKNKAIKNEIETLVFCNETSLSNFNIRGFGDYDKFEENLEIKEIEVRDSDTDDEMETLMTEANEKEEKVMFLHLKEKKEENQFEAVVSYSDSCKEKNVNKIVDHFENYFEDQKLLLAGITEEEIALVVSGQMINVTDIEEADKSIGVILLGVFLPMLSTLLIYMLILLHGQSVSKNLVVEKNSKLMENLLVSVKPYAIVTGKVLAMYVIAVSEVLLWFVSGVIGYKAGDLAASHFFEKYSNPVTGLLTVFRKTTADAFSTSALIISILAIFIGFLVYFVLSALISSGITKAEDLANGSSIYQVIVAISFICAYLLPLSQGNSLLIKILRFIPVTAAYMIPADVLLGSISIGASLVSMLIMVITLVVMIVITGKIYRKKLF